MKGYLLFIYFAITVIVCPVHVCAARAINPPPAITASAATGNILTCAGTPSASPDVQQFTVSATNLTADITATAPSGFEVSLSASSGFGNTATLVQSGGSLSNTVVYVRASATAPPGNISGNVILSTPGTANQNVAVQGTVNALPTANAVSNQTVTSGSATTVVTFTGSANVFTWVNDTPGIGLAASGTGNIPFFTAINNGSTPITATITVTPSSQGLAYVPDYGSSTVSVINTTTNTIAASINVGIQPQGVSVSPDGSKVYVTNGYSNTLSVISTSTNKVTATINTGVLPYGVTVSPDGTKVYVANTSSNSVSVINAVTNKVITSIGVGVRPVGVVLSADGGTLYVSNSVTNTVSVISTLSNAVTATITFASGSSPWGLAITPDGIRMYVVGSNSNKVSVINLANNTIVATIPVGGLPEGIAISPDGKRAYVTNYYSDLVLIIDIGTNTVVGSIESSQNPSGISVYPDGSKIYVANTNSSSVSVINTSTNKLTSTIQLGNNTNPISLGNFIIGGTGCSGAPVTFTITVNPASVVNAGPVSGSISACTGTASANPNLQQFTVTASRLFSNITAAAPAGFEVSASANTGFGSTVTLVPAGGNLNMVVYARSAAAASVGSISGNVVLSSPGISNINVAISGTINALPTVKPIANQVVLSGLATAAVNFTGTANIFTWVNDNPGIGLAASGMGNIAPVTAINNSNAPITAIITVTPHATSGAMCSGTPVTFTITVNSPFQPGIASVGNLTDLSTVYGTPSAATTLSVSGINISGGILVTPPAGFEVSTDGANFSNTMVVGQSGSIAATTVYIRLASSTPAGLYTGNIVLRSSGAADVPVAMSNGTVSPAPLTIATDNITRFYKTPNPPLTASYIGFVNNDGVAQLLVPPTISTTAVTSSPAGNYLILVNGAVSPNYSITYVDGMLTVEAYQQPVIPNTFTPNGDSINDQWDIKHLQDYQNCTVQVFDRAGQQVYRSVGYAKPWDGNLNGRPLPFGCYYYMIDLGDGSKPISGPVTIVR